MVFAVTNPNTGNRELEMPFATDAEIDQAAARVSAAVRRWGFDTAAAERIAVVQAVARLHRERRDELADLIVREIGKPVGQAHAEIDFAADIYDYYATHALELLRDEPVDVAEGWAVIRKQPFGALLGIMPWNYPFYQVARFAAPNLVLGNTILLKHAEQCPTSALAIQQILDDAGAPDGVYANVFATTGHAAALIADDRIAGVSFTGSDRAGAQVAELAGRHLKKVVLELGGSDPFIVLDDHDLDEVVAQAVAARLENGGQACNAAKRFIVVAAAYDAFAERFVAAMAAVQPGDPAAGADLGPLSSRTAADLLCAQIDDAVRGGATVLLRSDRDGTAVGPVVLTDVAPDSPASRQEFFGPVAVLHRVTDAAAAVSLANSSPFGLGGYVFARDEQLALRTADALEAGMVYVNNIGGAEPQLPFGGVKRSGFGRELGRLGIEEFMNRKLVRVVPR